MKFQTCKHPRFISFEGIDFSGKSTQIALLEERLGRLHFSYRVVREPGGTAVGESIRQVLLTPRHQQMNPVAEILLFEAARAQLVAEKLWPWLEEGIHLIADRFADSTTAYQGYGRGLEIELVEYLNHVATSGLTPVLTILLDIQPEEAERRRKKQGKSHDRMEAGGLDFYRRVREGFLQIARREPDRFLVLDGEQSPEALAGQIWRAVSKVWQIPVPPAAGEAVPTDKRGCKAAKGNNASHGAG